MKRQVACKFLGSLFLAAAIVPAAARGHPKIGDPGVITAPGSNQKIAEDGKVSFTVDASAYKNLFSWPEFLSADHIAVIFGGEATKGRECPYFASIGRTRTIKRVRGLIYNIEATATAEETEAARKAQCMMTERPTLEELGIWKKNEPVPNPD